MKELFEAEGLIELGAEALGYVSGGEDPNSGGCIDPEG
jgi:hypothetical protein